MHDRDRSVRELQVGIELRNGRIGPILDLAEINVREKGPVK
jgi:hypothetical protein